MKAKKTVFFSIKAQQNCKNIEQLDLTEVNELEAELVVGGLKSWGFTSGSTSGSGSGTGGAGSS